MAWNPNIPANRRIETTKKTLGRPSPKPTHVVCHITGTNSFSSVKQEFTTQVSAHYVIDKEGAVFQFVQEDDQAWHAGIKSPVQALYRRGPKVWRKYLYYFDWYKYPAGCVFVDDKLKPVEGGRMATFVAREDGDPWDHYSYFDDRWGAQANPVNYDASTSPNAYSVGIEVLSVGSKKPGGTAYTEPMYKSLRKLVSDICDRNDIPMKQGRVVGHEDVNPVQRFGWDPNQGFDWMRVWE